MLKPGVSLRGVRPETVVGMMVVARVVDPLTTGMIVTSGTEGKHKRASAHYTGRAFDIRRWDMIDLEVVVDKLRIALGGEWDVILEPDHIHIEFDPKDPLSKLPLQEYPTTPL